MVLPSRAGLMPSEFPHKLKLLRLTVPPSPVIKLPEPPLELTSHSILSNSQLSTNILSEMR